MSGFELFVCAAVVVVMSRRRHLAFQKCIIVSLSSFEMMRVCVCLLNTLSLLSGAFPCLTTKEGGNDKKKRGLSSSPFALFKGVVIITPRLSPKRVLWGDSFELV